MLKLDLGNGLNVTFQKEWVDKLRSLPIGEYGKFIRDSIYAELPARDRRSWDRSQISNKDLQTAVQAYQETPTDPDH